ncbi:MAG: ATP-binding protein [Bacteroidales bacterium]|nr:ATP-binding protein [Bacteroidales bacterium]
MLSYRLILLLLCLLVMLNARPQSTSLALQIDSLEQKLPTAETSERVGLLLRLADLSFDIDPMLSETYVKQAIGIPDSLVAAGQRFKLLIMAARISQANGKHLEFENYLNQALEIMPKERIETQLAADNKLKEMLQLDQKTGKSSTVNFFRIVSFALIAFIFIMLVYIYVANAKTRRQLLARRTELADLESKLNNLEHNIEQEVEKRTEVISKQLSGSRKSDLELKKALKKAEDANYLKNAFLGNMSHEIRTPLNGIIGFSSLLETELSMLENQELFGFAQGIQQSGDRLLNLLNNIIDISRIEAHDIEVELHPCNMNDIVKNLVELHQFSANEKGLAFKFKPGELPLIVADNSCLTRIVNVVIENAIKYTEAGFVNILTQYQPNSNEVLLRVKDTGVGMDQDYMKHLFEAFRQESSGYSRSYQGAGLGLPLAKKLLDLMNGRIEIISARSVGTTVEVFLPCQASEARNVSIPNIQRTSTALYGSLDIFIVEDDRMNRLVLQKMLNKAGTCTIAVDGDETMKIIRERYKKGHVFQIMLFDINLPAPWDGVKLLKTIRQEYKEYRSVPFIAQTAYAMAGDREKLLEAGFDDYLSKPLSKNELLTIINNQLDKFKAIID